MQRLASSGAPAQMLKLVSKRLLATKSNAMPSSSPAASAKTPAPSIAPSRFPYAKKPGTVSVVKKAKPPPPAPPPDPAPDPALSSAVAVDPEQLTQQESKRRRILESHHVRDLENKNGLLYWMFPRGKCPKYAIWNQRKPKGATAAQLRWTGGQMYTGFWPRAAAALTVSGLGSSIVWMELPNTAVGAHLAAMAPGVDVIAVLASLVFALGVYRSRIVQQAWVGLIASETRLSGSSMRPTIMLPEGASAVAYVSHFRPMSVKRGDFVCLWDPIPDSMPNKGKYPLSLAKRVIGLEYDVIRTGALGSKDMPYYLVPPGRVFVLGDNLGNSLDSKYFGALPITDIRSRIKAYTTAENPKRGDWHRVATLRDHKKLLVTDRQELRMVAAYWKKQLKERYSASDLQAAWPGFDTKSQTHTAPHETSRQGKH